MDNLVITENMTVKVRDLTNTYVFDQSEKTGVDKKEDYKFDGKKVPESLLKKDFSTTVTKDFPYIFIDRYNFNDEKKEKLDVYSLGMVLYKILFEKFPFHEDIEQFNSVTSENSWDKW